MYFETTRKTEIMKKSVTMFVMVFIAIGMYISGAISGTIVESRWHFMKPVEVNGLPKGSIPEAGAAMHIEAVFPDRTFVAVYAGERAYYNPLTKISIWNLEGRTKSKSSEFKTEDIRKP